MEILQKLFSSCFNVPISDVEALKQAGSNRRYYRLRSAEGRCVIGVVGTSRQENHAFITLSRHLRSKGITTPEVYAVSDDEMRYLQEDFGTLSLFDAITVGRESGEYSEKEVGLLRQTLSLLPKIQHCGAEGLDWTVCYPQPYFDVTNVMFDLNYFKYCFLKATDTDFHEMLLEKEFQRLAQDITEGDSESLMGFMYRDFQARNVMITPDGSPGFIDFQGGRRGPVYYDVASFLWQASARYPAKLREELTDVYYDALRTLVDVPSPEAFRRRLELFVFFRTLQVLGAYGFRGYFERKEHFLKSIPQAIENLAALLPSFRNEYPYLTEVMERMMLSEKLRKRTPARPSSYDGKGRLTVKVWSFSYKKGIPEDDSGNGGGYVFDCRGTHNPGRYEEYKHLTGLDEPVKRFLEDDGEILDFLKNIYPLAERHVRRYMERGFTSLTFAFGCTGGQHRSVYSAQHLAEYIHEKFGVTVILRHREQNIQCILQ